MVIVRHKDIDIHLLEQMSTCLKVPVINAMTNSKGLSQQELAYHHSNAGL